MAKSNSKKSNKNNTSKGKTVCARCGRNNNRAERPNCKNVAACFQRFMQ
jgi:hypothetical protein